MIVLLAAVTALICIAVAAGLRTRADRIGRFGSGPPSRRLAERDDLAWPRLRPARRRNSQRPPVDDAYTAWFNANSRCAEALQAWRKAAPTARREAYRAYLAELALEQAAAAELEMQAMVPAA